LPVPFCEPAADVEPIPAAAAATPIPPDVSKPLLSRLQPSVSNSGQSIGRSWASIRFAAFTDGCATGAEFV
jgi:hypothetical protein